MKKFVVMFSLLAFVAGIPAMAFAETGKCDCPCHKSFHKKHKHEFMGKLSKELNLTTDQKAKVKIIKDQIKPQMEPIFNQMKTEREKFIELKKNNASKEELQSQKAKMHELMKKAKAIQEQNMVNFEQILTPEQKTKFNEMKEQRKKAFEARKQKWEQKRSEKEVQ